ncbi:tetratricopeptide repeat protein [Streptomyces sp. CL12-4]|uniref:tetratricopeptide repeat protein n=1 Tax=Streptomyces sp. CL12-4 TaxID=2810306 RepID=UPI001EFA6E65|nr:tetratricopeptide repeat protein [Streptomyces sp. CL12-4]MCG8968777.1 tetratricopeptide repeat protein [Streptomyces sp. CL12-4]
MAGRDVNGSSTQYVQAEQAFVLPAEVYASIPQDAAGRGISNIEQAGLFVGRTEELSALDAAFADPGEVVVHTVHGLGGVGKSALAAQWAAGRSETVRWWVTADTQAAVDAGVAALARALQPGLAGLPAELQAERALRWLADHRSQWLLVLDNVEDPADIRPLLARVSGGRVLVTTRLASGWHRHATTIRLGVLDPADAVGLFTRVLTQHGPRNTDGVDAACAALGYLALAIDQAAAYCAETGTSPDVYLDMLDRWPAEMFDAAAQGGDSARTIARIWRLTLDRLTDTPLAGDLLRLLAWYAPDRIPRDLLTDMAAPPGLAAAIGQLAAYNMITDNHDGTLSVHRLVQALARTPDPCDPHRHADDISRARDHAAELLANTYPDDSHNPANWPRYQALLPHTDALTTHHTPDHDTVYTAAALSKAAAYRAGQGALAAALHACERVLTTCQRVLGEDHPDTLASRNSLATAYRDAGDLARAIPLFEQTLTDRRRVLGENHPSTLNSRNSLATAYRDAGDLARAIPLFEQTLTDTERVLGEDHPDTLNTRNSLAYAYRDAGDLARAIPLFEQTLTDTERVLGEDHPDTLASRNSLATAYRDAGDLARAIPLFEQTLTNRTRVLGENHPDTLTSRNDLAYAYQAAGDLDRAIPLYQQTLTNRTRVLGENHPDTLTSRNNLAYAYQAAGDLDRAIPLYQQTLTNRTRVLDEDHPDTLASRNNLATAYRAAGDLERAIPLYEQTLTDTERVMGENHPRTLISRNNLAYAYQAAGDLDRAIPLYEQTLTDRTRVLGENHPDTLASRNNLASAYQDAGDLARAIPLFEQTLTDAERVLSPGHPVIAVLRMNMERARSVSDPNAG